MARSSPLSRALWARWHGAAEVVLFAALMALYEVVRWLVRPRVDDIATALHHADQVVRAERALGLYVEADVQRITLDAPGGQWLVTTIYSYGHTPVFIAVFVALWRWRRPWYPFLRAWFWIAHAIAVTVFWLWPLAPPRLAALGLEDTTREALRAGGALNWFQQFRNEFAAMPSFHIGYAVLFAAIGWLMLRGRRHRWIVWVWPLVMTWVTMATANHYWLDGVGGAATMAAACVLAALLLPRVMPRPWSYPATAEDSR